jgi:hypothetical protein
MVFDNLFAAKRDPKNIVATEADRKFDPGGVIVPATYSMITATIKCFKKTGC